METLLFIFWLKENDLLQAFIKELENIGNQTFFDVICDLEDYGDISCALEDDLFIQWDCAVSDINWEEKETLWIAYCEKEKESSL